MINVGGYCLGLVLSWMGLGDGIRENCIISHFTFITSLYAVFEEITLLYFVLSLYYLKIWMSITLKKETQVS